MHWPSIRGLAASAGVRLRVKETEISFAPWAKGSGKDFTFTFTTQQVQIARPQGVLNMTR